MNEDLNEKVVKLETKVNIEVEHLKSEISTIKGDVSTLKDGHSESNASIRELNTLLTESYKSLEKVIVQNSNVISEMGKKIEESNKINDERYIEMIKINSRQDIDSVKENNEIRKESSNKKDAFIEFLIDLGKDILKYSLAGGLLYYILTQGVIKF